METARSGVCPCGPCLWVRPQGADILHGERGWPAGTLGWGAHTPPHCCHFAELFKDMRKVTQAVLLYSQIV